MPPATTEFRVERQHSNDVRSVSSKEPCPLCNGEYQCYIFGDKVGCASFDEAPEGWEKLKQDKNGRWIFAPAGSSSRKYSRSGKQRKGKTPKVTLPSADEVLPLLLANRTEDDFPQWVETGNRHGDHYESQIEYLYPCPETGEPLGKVVRKQWSDRRPCYGKDRNQTKEIKPWHWVNPSHPDEGTEGWWSDRGKGKKAWGLYQQQEIELEVAAGGEIQVLFGIAGEEAVESTRKLGLWAITNQGGEGSFVQQTVDFVSQCAKPKLFVIFGDNDPTGRGTSTKLLAASLKAGIPTINLDPLGIWEEMPHKGDITNVLKESGMSQDEIIRKLEEQIRQQLSDQNPDSTFDAEGTSDEWDIPNSHNPNEEFTQFTLNTLYGDKPWICADDKLHYWTGTHYKHSKDAVEIKRIADWCNSYAVPSMSPEGQIVFEYPYAKPSKVKQALEWVKMRLSVDSDLLDPPGLNCTNGVLQISWKDDQPSWELIPHDPNLYYTYEPLVKFDPDANPEACEKMLSALDDPQQDIYLKTVGASLDLRNVRKKKGRAIKGVLCLGDGENGKDTLRTATTLLYGNRGVTGCTLTDFVKYDEGRKFPLAKLQESRVNWASENAKTSRLDDIQSLKRFITGEPLDKERKGVDEESFEPVGVAFFNVNDVPNIRGAMNAIKSRYAILTFDKTFKMGANPTKGEIEADPRFKYDPEFMQAEVLPAFLNKVLDALARLMKEGINYGCTEEALEKVQQEYSHLFRFSQDVGLGYQSDSYVTAADIWEKLEQWYLEDGTLEYEEGSNGKSIAIWTDQSKPSDRNVKAVNQVIPRFLEIFPKAERGAIRHLSGKKPQPIIKGIGFIDSNDPRGSRETNLDFPTPIPPQPTPIPPQSPPQQTTENQDFHPNHPSFSTPDEKIQNSLTDLSNVNQETQKNSDTPQQLGWVGCDAQKLSVLGVGNCGGTGVEIEQTGVGTAEEAIAPSPALQLAALLRLTQCWEEVEAVTEAVSPQVKKEAWALLPSEEKGRINSLKEITPTTPCENAPEAAQTPVEDETVAIDEKPAKKEQLWAWSKTTGGSLGEVLHIEGNRVKIKRSGEPSYRAKYHSLKDITFENPTVSALSLNVAPVVNTQWGEDEQYLEEVDD